MMIVKMNKDFLGTFGDVYTLTFGNVEKESSPNERITISECQAERLAPMFSNSKESGKYNENKEWF